MPGPQEEIFEPVAAFLLDKIGVPSFFGENALFEEHAAPRMVWLPSNGTPAEPVTDNEDETRSFGDVLLNIDIWLHGQSYDEAYALLSPLVTAMRDIVRTPVSLAGYQTIGKESATEGEVIAVSFVVRLPVWEYDFDGNQSTVVIEDVGFFNEGAADPDGELTVPKE